MKTCVLAVVGAWFTLVYSGVAADEYADLQEFVRNKMDAGNIPAISAAVTVADRLAWRGAFGSAWPQRGGALYKTDNETRFTFASISKTITGVAVLMLRERGLLDIEADINMYLPYEVGRSGITTAQLMRHVSSITDDYYYTIPRDELYVDGDPLISLERFNREIFSVGGRWYSPRTFVGQPGERYDYSNIGSSLAACVVEQVARNAGLATDYNTFIQDYVFGPLGALDGTGSHYLRDFFDMMEPPIGARPSIFENGAYKSWKHYSVPDYPNGFWRSNAATYAKILGMIANDGLWQGVRLLTSESIQFLQQVAAPPNDDGRQGRAFFRYAGHNLLGHGGGELGIATEAYIDLHTGVGAVVLTNGDFSQGEEFDEALQAILERLLRSFSGVQNTTSLLSRPLRYSPEIRSWLSRVHANRSAWLGL